MGDYLDPAAISTAVLTAVRTAVDPFEVGDGEPPRSIGASFEPGAFVPYAVMFPSSGGTTEGPFAYPDAGAWVPYQFTSVGETRLQAESLQGKIRDAMIGTQAGGSYPVAISGSGFVVMRRRLVNGGGGTRREGSVFNSVDVFTVQVHLA